MPPEVGCPDAFWLALLPDAEDDEFAGDPLLPPHAANTKADMAATTAPPFNCERVLLAISFMPLHVKSHECIWGSETNLFVELPQGGKDRVTISPQFRHPGLWSAQDE